MILSGTAEWVTGELAALGILQADVPRLLGWPACWRSSESARGRPIRGSPEAVTLLAECDCCMRRAGEGRQKRRG